MIMPAGIIATAEGLIQHWRVLPIRGSIQSCFTKRHIFLSVSFAVWSYSLFLITEGVNPLVHASTSTVHSNGGCVHERVNTTGGSTHKGEQSGAISFISTCVVFGAQSWIFKKVLADSVYFCIWRAVSEINRYVIVGWWCCIGFEHWTNRSASEYCVIHNLQYCRTDFT